MAIPARHANLLFAGLISLLMVFFMSGIIVAINRGLGAGYIGAWMHRFIIAWPIAFALVLVLAPRVRALVARLVSPD